MSNEHEHGANGATDMGTAALEALEREATALETEAAPKPAPGEHGTPEHAAEVMNTATELAGALTMARAMLSPVMAWWPHYSAAWSDATIKQISQAGAEVMDRHGWTMGEAWSKYGPYVALAGALLPPCVVTYQAVQHHRTQVRQEAQRVERGAADGSHQQAPN